jgi:hypothetical protein
MNNTLPPTAHQDFLNLAKATDRTTLKSLLALKPTIQELKAKTAEILAKCYKIRQAMETDPNMEGYLHTTDAVVRLGGNLEWIDGLLVINLSDIDEAEGDLKSSLKLETTLTELSSSMANLGWIIVEGLPGIISKQTYKHPDLQILLVFTIWMRDNYVHQINIDTGESVGEPLATGVKPAEALELVKESINCCIVEKKIDRVDRDIIKLIWRDYSNAQIATELSLSSTVVTAKIKSIKSALQLKSRQDIKNYYTANLT